MHVGEEDTAKRKLSNWKKIQNIQHHKSMAAKSVPFYYCQQVSSIFLLIPPPFIHYCHITPAMTFIHVVYLWHPSLPNGSFLFI